MLFDTFLLLLRQAVSRGGRSEPLFCIQPKIANDEMYTYVLGRLERIVRKYTVQS